MSAHIKAAAQKRRLFNLLYFLVALGVAFLLLVVAIGKHVDFYCEPLDIKLDQHKITTCSKLGGLVSTNSLQYLPAGGLKFAITDGADTITISYNGLLPDLFKEGRGVVVEGKFSDPNHFIASRVLAKHDENYTPKPLQQSLNHAR